MLDLDNLTQDNLQLTLGWQSYVVYVECII